MWSPLPVLQLVRSRIKRWPAREIEAVAKRTWEIAPGEQGIAPRAYFLPDQLERVIGWDFMDEHPAREMNGIAFDHVPTRGALLENAWLIDGVLYKADACLHLHPRSRKWPSVRVDREIARAALFCTPGGNRYFGTWMMDDCPRYALAEAEGEPVTTAHPVSEHLRDYEQRFAMRPTRVQAAFLRECVIFSDSGQNRDKHRRCRALTDKLLAGVDAKPHPGVFMVRGAFGERRILRDEIAIAERLRDRRGFRIVDPMQLDVATIIATCAGARVVVGIEGSAMMHGIQLLHPGTAVLVLQPPTRFCNLYKHIADRDGQHYGFVVGRQEGADFRITPDEVERTLDLFPASVHAF
ncbi:MAG TPA: glycosyltransferase family 61 protein [Nannocystaceae bacterium]|nr:glycosyltransferase family 61 protein [Nannocystaceae bacterium]